MQHDIEKNYSQHWQVYRIATHEKGGFDLAIRLSRDLTLKDMNDILESLDVYDSLKEEAYQKAKSEAKVK